MRDAARLATNDHCKTEIHSFRRMSSFTRPSWFCLIVAGLLVGCATSSQPVEVSYDASSNQKAYETKQIRLDDMRMTEGLERDNRFYVQVSASCMGQDCVPERYTMSFLKEGPQSVRIEGRDVRLTVGTETMTWEDPQSRNVNRTSSIRSGTFARIELTSKQLTTVGSVQSVSGTVGSASFSLSHKARTPIRKLLSRLEKEAGSSE